MNYSECIDCEAFRVVSEIADNLHQQVFLVGGFVRDLLINRDSKDVDIVTEGSGIELAKSVAHKLSHKIHVSYFKNFGTAMFKYDGVEYEFVGARKESYNRDSRNPIVENGTIEDDQKRRDFTINALAISLNADNYGELIDPFDGVNDLKRGLIRTPLDPDITFSDDPLRIMRAIRFATQLNFHIDNVALSAIIKNRDRLKIISKERINEELNKIILSKKPSIGFKLMDKADILTYVLPELSKLKGVETKNGQSHKDNFLHTLQVLDNLARLSDDLWLRWSALFHDIGKARTKRYVEGTGWTFHGHEFIGAKMVPNIFKRLKLPMNQKMRYVSKIVLLHMRPIVLVQDVVTDSAVRRLLFEAGDNIDDVMKLCEADITSKNPEKVQKYLNNYQLVRQKLKDVEEKDKVRNFQPPITGQIIMLAFDLEPCQLIGDIKSAIKEAIIEGEIENSFDSAWDYMVTFAKQNNLELKMNSSEVIEALNLKK